MFKKLKDFYKRNRVYSILMFISIFCIVAIFVGIILYFFNQTSKDKYGSRLDGINDIIISDTRKDEFVSSIMENELVDSVSIDIKGKLIYIDIILKTGKHSDSESIAQKSLELFNEQEKGFYDIQFIVNNLDENIDENFPVMGYIKKGNSIIKWTIYHCCLIA